MREIKFRGKRIDNGELACGHLCYIENEPVIIAGYVKQTNGSLFHCNTFYFIIPETVGQYTGLKDKNGVEIYEGDIVLYKFASYKDISKVVYDEDSASFKMISIKEDDNTSWREFKKGSIHDFYKPFVNGYDFVKVIGNIYENPELLEVE